MKPPQYSNVSGEKTAGPAPLVRGGGLFRYATWRDKCTFGVAVFWASMGGLNQPLQLVVFGSLMDSFNEPSVAKAVRMVNFFALMYMLLGCAQIVTVTAQTACSTKVAATQARRVRERYFAALMAQPVAWFDGENQGALAASVLEATLSIQDGLGEKFTTALQGICSFFFGLAISLWYAWSLTLVSVGAVPFIVCVLWAASKFTTKSKEASNEASTSASAIAMEALGNIRTVVAFGGEHREVKRYLAAVTRSRDNNARLGVAMGVNAALVNSILFGTWALGLWYGSYLIRRDMIAHENCNYRVEEGTDDISQPAARCLTGGDVMTSFLCVLFGGLALLQAIPGVTAFAEARQEASRVFAIIDRAEAAAAAAAAEGTSESEEVARTEDLESALPQQQHGAEIAFERVAFAYPSRRDRPVYSALELRIASGSTVALVGQSGCGKSTAVSLLLRFYDVDAGRVQFDGQDVRELDAKALRRKIGLVSQEPVLFSGTVAENIGYGSLGASLERVHCAAKMANAHTFIEGFPDGYATQVGECGVQLSGGQKQRVAIARALIRKPRLLVLDEATSALDTTSEKVVQKALDALTSGGERTTLVIAHRLSTVRRATKIAVFHAGAVVEEGTHDELMRREQHYFALVEAQLSQAVTEEASSSSSSSSGDLVACEAAAREDNAFIRDVSEVTVAVPIEVVVVGGGGGEEDFSKVRSKAVTVEAAQAASSSESSVKERDLLKWLWRYGKNERFALVVGLCGAAAVGAQQPAIGYCMAEFIVAFFNVSLRAMRREARFWAYAFVCMGCSVAVASVLQGWGIAKAGESVLLLVRKDAFRQLLRQPIAWHDSTDRTAGTLVAQLGQDCNAIRALVGARLASSVTLFVVLVGGLAISFEASWRLSLVTIGILPLIVAPIAVTAKYVDQIAKAAGESLHNAGGVANEAVLHVRTVRAFGLERVLTERFESHLALPERQAIRKGLATGAGSGLAAGCVLWAASFQYYIGGIFFREGFVDFGSLMKVLLVMIFLAFGVGAVSGDIMDKTEAMHAAKKIYAWLQLHSAIDVFTDDDKDKDKDKDDKGDDDSALLRLRSGGASVEFKDVAFRYPSRLERPVYTSLSLEIAANTTCALVGESGSGKSTAVQLLLRYYDVDAGAVLLDGVDVRELRPRALRAVIGLVSQEPVLFTGSIADNIRYGAPEASDAQVHQAAQLANAHTFIAGDGKGTGLPESYATQVGSRGIQLSGGQKQRIAIARALIRAPRVLILDEATSALDAASERVVQAALDDLARDTAGERTTLVIAHRLSTVRAADAIAVLSKDGLVVEKGTHEELVQKRGAYYALVLTSEGAVPPAASTLEG